MTELFKKNNKKEKNRFFWRKSQKIILLILLIYLSLGFYQIAEAQSAILGLGSAALRFVLNLLTFAIGAFHWFVGAVLFKFAGLTLNFAFNVNLNLLSDLNENHFILIGWTIFRDLANLGFVFGIIVIAVATILRFKSYTYQTLLPKFIAAALLVNFSLVIASSIISLSDVFSNFFISSSSNGSIDALARKIVDKSMVIRIIEGGPSEEEENLMIESIPDQSEINEIKKKDESGLSIVFYEFGGVLVSTLVMFFVFITLLAMALYLILRYFNLAFLLILSPIVWILWVFPATSGYWKKWWQSFIHWVFMPPLILFFINITLVFLSGSDGGFGSRAKEVVSSAQSGSIAGIGFENLMLPLMAGALLLGGLKISQTMGFAGASFTLKAADSLGGWAKKKVQRGGARVGRRMLGEPTRKVLNKIGSSKVANILTFGGARRLAQGATAARVALEKKSQEYVEQRIGQYNSIDSKKLAALIPTMNDEERLAALEILSRRGDLNEAQKYIKDIDEIRRSLEVAQTLGRGKAVSDIQKSMDMTIEMMKAIKAGAPIEVERDGKKVTMSYEELAKEYYEKFSPSDWAKTASALGNSIFDPSGRNLPGMTDEQSKLFRKSFVDNIVKGVGEGIFATLPKLSRKSAREMMKKVVESVAGEAKEIDIQEAIDKALEEKNFEEVARLRELKETGVKKIKIGTGRDEILEAIKDDDLDRAVDLMKKSGDPRLINIANKLSKSIGSALLLTKEEEKEEKKESSLPTPPSAKPSGGGGGKSGGTP